MSSLDSRAGQRYNHAPGPRLQPAVHPLQMSSPDFAALVRDALDRNPFLEIAEGAGADTAATAAAPEPACGDDLAALETMAVEDALNIHLHAQLDLLPLSARDLALARTIVESLDDDGYLRSTLGELLDVTGLDPAPSLSEMQFALKRVQALDPAGVGARSVAECLRLQLPSIPCPTLRGLARTIVDEQLHVLAARDLATLARRLGTTQVQVQAVWDRIRRLDPRPGWRLGPAHAADVVPDVTTHLLRGQWTVQLNPAVVPRVRLNQVHAQASSRSAPNGERDAQLQDALRTLRDVESRCAAILGVARAIVERQRDFLDYGPMAMKPLGLRQIADAIGMPEGTVACAARDKYIATPNGVFELKYFFSRARVGATGPACSAAAIRGRIHDIIAAEKPDVPLSDAEITRELAQQGLPLARRTVTRYRQLLRTEEVDRGRRHGALAPAAER